MSQFLSDKVFYIPGLKMVPEPSATFYKLKSYFTSKVDLMEYDVRDPEGSLSKMLSQVDGYHKSDIDVIIVASSLGGWFANCIARLRTVGVVLYNPSMYPERSLSKYGIEKEVLAKYKEMQFLNLADSLYRVVLCEDDEVISHKMAEEYFKDYTIIHTKGGHRMTQENLEHIIIPQINSLSQTFYL